MPAYAFVEEEYGEEGDVYESDITDCGDVDQLLEWHDGMESVVNDILGQIHAFSQSGMSNDHWVYRACQRIGYLRRGQTRIKRRLRQIGHNLNPHGDAIHSLNTKLSTMKAESAFARAFVALAQTQMLEREYRALSDAALAKIEGT